jgi:membrane protease YdiL (CAAX protease family)
MTTGPASAAGSRGFHRSASLRRAFLFLAVCSPLWLGFTGAGPVAMLAVVLGITLLFLRWDGRPAAELGLDGSWHRVGELIAGVGGGALLIGLVSLGTWIFLPFPWATNPRFEPAAAGWSLLWLLLSNSSEELIFRGYSFERLITAIGIWKAQLVTALLFAVFHIVNGWPWQVALVGTTAGSILFGFVFIRWKTVPAAIGVHVAGNWVRGLLLVDPPTSTTLFAPLAPRPWTAGEQMGAMAIFLGLVVLASCGLWLSVRGDYRERPPPGSRAPAP